MEAPPCLRDLGFGRSGLYYEGVVDDLEKSDTESWHQNFLQASEFNKVMQKRVIVRKGGTFTSSQTNYILQSVTLYWRLMYLQLGVYTCN